MCHKGTARLAAVAAALTLAALAGRAQQRPDWRQIGPSCVELMLASPVSGAVDRVWFSPAGSTLYAQTRTGAIFATADFETWSAAPDADAPPPPMAVYPARMPEQGANVVAPAGGSSTIFALKRNVYRSRDGGHSWENLTAFGAQPIIGGGQHSVAVSPRDPNEIVVANDYGVWRSMDGGLTWAGLNQSLPNLAVRRIVATPTGTTGTRIQVDALAPVLELPPGGSVWTPVVVSGMFDEQLRERLYSSRLGIRVAAVAVAGQIVYAGGQDGSLWYSTDGGTQFQRSSLLARASGPVARIWVDPAHPNAALAALGGDGAHVLHTFNGGLFWDAMDSDLPDAPARSVTADAAAGAIYVATAKGVFWTTTDLLGAGSNPHWTELSAGLPSQSAYDVKLDPAGVQIYVAVEGYGVFAAAAPHSRRSLRLISAADFSTRPAAPGSLLSVVGGRVTAARGDGLDYAVLATPAESDSQIQVPYGAVGPTVSLALNTETGVVTVPLSMQDASPAIFVFRDGAPWIYDGDSGEQLSAASPAHSNGRIQILATGLGRVRPDFPAGAVTPQQNPPSVVAPVKAFLNGEPIEVTRAILAPGLVGVYLVEAQLPVIANFGSSQLYLSVDGQESNRVQMVIEP